MKFINQMFLYGAMAVFLTGACGREPTSEQDPESSTSVFGWGAKPQTLTRPNSAGYWEAMKAVSSRYRIPVKKPHDFFEINMQQAQVVRLTRKVNLPKGEAVVSPPWNLESGDRWGIKIGGEKYEMTPIKNGPAGEIAPVDIVYDDGKGRQKKFSVDDPQTTEDIKKLLKHLEDISAKDPGGIAPSLRDAVRLLTIQQEAF